MDCGDAPLSQFDREVSERAAPNIKLHAHLPLETMSGFIQSLMEQQSKVQLFWCQTFIYQDVQTMIFTRSNPRWSDLTPGGEI